MKYKKRKSRYRDVVSECGKRKPEIIVEIGTWNGWTAMEMINEAKEYNEEIFYFGFDLFEDLTDEKSDAELSKTPKCMEEVKKFIEDLTMMEATVTLIKGETSDTLPDFILNHLDFKADFIFIDGGHSVETIKNDWSYCERMMHDNTVVVFDDYYGDKELAKKFGCNNQIEVIKNSGQYDVEIFGKKDEFSIGTVRLAKVTRGR